MSYMIYGGKIVVPRYSDSRTLYYNGFKFPVAFSRIFSFYYTGEVQEITLQPGTYEIKCWGANGGNAGTKTGGKGGYSKGTLNVGSTTNYYLYVGGRGSDAASNAAGGWNGGGNSGAGATTPGGAGGGGTDIRTTQNSTYSNRIIVAGAGGGAGTNSSTISAGSDYGGMGGGTNGQAGGYVGVNDKTATDISTTSTCCGQGGTQSAGGIGGYDDRFPADPTRKGGNGALGIGGTGSIYNSIGNSGGGGGYYGGGGAGQGGKNSRHAGGGSGYIGGVSEGITLRYNEEGFQENPDTTGHGFIRITKI